jgi:DNA-directed RNA polymerase sigma subunit (sigma70/sigma32)
MAHTMESLAAREQDVLRRRFGCVAGERQTLEAVGPGIKRGSQVRST